MFSRRNSRWKWKQISPYHLIKLILEFCSKCSESLRDHTLSNWYSRNIEVSLLKFCLLILWKFVIIIFFNFLRIRAIVDFVGLFQPGWISVSIWSWFESPWKDLLWIKPYFSIKHPLTIVKEMPSVILSIFSINFAGHYTSCSWCM